MPSTTAEQCETLRANVQMFLTQGFNFRDAERLFQTVLIDEALRLAHGNECRAARALGIHRNTLSRYIQKLRIPADLVREQFRRPPRSQGGRHANYVARG